MFRLNLLIKLYQKPIFWRGGNFLPRETVEKIMIRFSHLALLAVCLTAASPLALADGMVAKPNITVLDYKEAPLEQADKGMATYNVTIKESFAGDIAGDAIAHYLQNRDAAGNAAFTGFERITGAVGGKKGSFLLQSAGTIKDGIVSGTWFVVPGSGTDELAKLSGKGDFKAKLGQAGEASLSYTLE